MKLAQIKDGVVVNVVMVDPENVPDFCADWPEITKGGVGWTYDGKAFAPPVVDPSAWRATASMSRGAFCSALIDAGVLPPSEAVTASRGEWPATFAKALDGMSEVAAAKAAIEWATATTIRRNHPIIAMLAAFSKMTDAQVDTLFGRQPPA